MAITLIDTGENTMIWGKIVAIKEYLMKKKVLFYLWDGLGTEIDKQIKFHKSSKKLLH